MIRARWVLLLLIAAALLSALQWARTALIERNRLRDRQAAVSAHARRGGAMQRAPPSDCAPLLQPT